MSKNVAVSVIMPTYNKARLVQESLMSLLRQKGLERPWEIVVVDNNSSDRTIHVLEQVSGKHGNLHYVSEIRQGAGAARNRGIFESRGELLIFLDDDILVMPDHVARHCAYHRDSKAMSCVVGYVEDCSKIESRILEQYVHMRASITTGGRSDRQGGLSLASGNFSVRRSQFDKIRFEHNGRVQYFDEMFYKRQDGELGYRMEKAGFNFVYAPDIYCEHRQAYRWGYMKRRCYFSGYYLQRLFAKHPELRRAMPHRVVERRLLNVSVLLLGFMLLGLGYMVRGISPWCMLKGVGSQLLYHASRGYQQARRDHGEGRRDEP